MKWFLLHVIVESREHADSQSRPLHKPASVPLAQRIFSKRVSFNSLPKNLKYNTGFSAQIVVGITTVENL